MRNLLQDADRDRLVAPLTGPMLREPVLAGRRHLALAEHPDSDLCPAEGAARAAELLLLPGLRETHGALAEALLDFAIAMAEAPMPCRRAGAGGIALAREVPRGFDLANPFYRLHGDLSRGELQWERRGAPRCTLRHSGNLVEFRIGRRSACVDVEENIEAQAIERRGDRLVLRHASLIHGEAGLFAARRVEAGRLEMEYEVAPDSPVLRVTARFTAARALSRVRVTTALDGLDIGGLVATAARIGEGAAWREASPPAAPGAVKWATGAPVAHLALGAAGFAAGAPVLHLRPLDPARVMSVTAEARHPGAVHWLLLRHGPADLAAGQVLEVREDRLLALGPEVAGMAAAMGREAAGLDLDPAPLPVATLMAVAASLLLAPPPAERRAALEGFARRQLDRIEAGEGDGAALAAAVIAADALARAGTPGMAARRAGFVDRLACRLDAEGALAGASLAGQALAILALARAAPLLPEAVAPLAAALGAVGQGAPPAMALAFAGRPVEPAAEAEGVALLCRAAGAAVLAAEAGAALGAGPVRQARLLHRISLSLLRPLVRPLGVGEGLGVFGRDGPSPGLQAAATLALLAPERLLADPAPA